MSLLQQLKDRRASLRGQKDLGVELGILTLLLGDLEQESINGKVYEKKLTPFAEGMERPEDPRGIEVVSEVEHLVEYVLVADNSEITDEKVEQRVRSFIKNNNTMIQLGGAKAEACARENAELSQFLPKQFDDETLMGHIKASGGTNIGAIMKYLKAYNGLYDGKRAQELIKQHLGS